MGIQKENSCIPPVSAMVRIVPAEAAIRPMDAALRPFSAEETLDTPLYFEKKRYRQREITKPDIVHPNVANTAPGIPMIRRPVNVEVLTARGPGVI